MSELKTCDCCWEWVRKIKMSADKTRYDTTDNAKNWKLKVTPEKVTPENWKSAQLTIWKWRSIFVIAAIRLESKGPLKFPMSPKRCWRPLLRCLWQKLHCSRSLNSELMSSDCFAHPLWEGDFRWCALFRDNTAQCMRSGRTFRNTGELVLLRRLRKQGNAEERPQYLASRVRR